MSSRRPEALSSTDLEHVYRSYFTEMMLIGQAAAEALNLHPTDLYAANVVEMAGTLTAGELAARTGLTTGAATRMIDRLEQASLARRRPDPADRRKVVVEKNADREKEFSKVFGPVEVRLAEILSAYSPEQLATLADYFTRSTLALREAGDEIRSIPRHPSRSSTKAAPLDRR
jgi:DNA-binding MarR family transcriptional regulator